MMGTSMGGAMTKDKEEKDTMNMMGGGYMKYNYGGKVKKMKKGGKVKRMSCPVDGMAKRGKTKIRKKGR